MGPELPAWLWRYVGMPNPSPVTRPLFTPSTLPLPAAPDPVVVFIEEALLAIANRQDQARIPQPSA